MFICYVNLFLAVNLYTTMANVENKEKKILVFGGNGFIGSETVLKLLSEGFKIVCVNRGNSYFDSKTRIDQRVTNIQCDRDEGLKNCKELKHQLNVDKFYNAVVDFSAYKPQAIKDSLKLLSGKIGLYVYISTDSVYEVCKKPQHDGFLKEEDAKRPENEEERKKLNSFEKYGHRKLACEEELVKHHNETKLPYVIFRLPDVLGPRDSTERWWLYQMWIQFFHTVKTPIMVPGQILNLKTSYVFVKDIAQAISAVLSANNTSWNTAYNLASDKPMTLGMLLNEVQMELNMEGVQYDNSDNYDSFYNFPSVSFGALDVSKIKRNLMWLPTPWHTAVAETVEFYTQALWKFPKERDDIVKAMHNQVVSLGDRAVFHDALRDFIDTKGGTQKKDDTQRVEF